MTRLRLSDSQLNISQVEAFLKEHMRGFDSKDNMVQLFIYPYLYFECFEFNFREFSHVSGMKSLDT